MLPSLRPASRWFLLAAAVDLAGCTSPPPPLQPPELETAVDYLAGTWLGQLHSEPAKETADAAWQVLLRCRHVPVLTDTDGYAPALSFAQMVTVEPTHHLLLPTSRSLAQVQLAVDPPAAAMAGPILDAVAAAAPPGATTELSVRWRRMAQPGRSAGTVSARIDRTGPQARVILLGGNGNEARDMVLLQKPFSAGSRLCALVPLGGGGDGLAIEWELRTAPAAGPEAARYRTLAEVADRRLAALRANAGRTPDAADQARRIGSLAGQVDSTSSLTEARSALRALAQSVGATLAEDVACVADQEAIERIAAEVRAEAGATADPKALSFQLERSSILLLAGRLEREELSPIADAILLARTGAVGRFPDRLREAVARANDLPSLDQVLIDENWRLLRDTGPAHRVRAFDWLRRRQLAPEGFDPLASAAEQRTALTQAERAMAQEGRR